MKQAKREALAVDGAERQLPIGCQSADNWLAPRCPVPCIHPPPAHRLHYPDISELDQICAVYPPIIHDEKERTMSDQAGCRILVISPTAARAHQFVERMHPSRLAPLARAQ